MRYRFQLFVVFVGMASFLVTSCNNNVASVHRNLNNLTLPTDTAGQLKDAANFPIGLGVNNQLLQNNSTYSNIVKQQFNTLTPEHLMKQTVIVQDNGSFNYSKPDKFVQTAKNMGLDVHGHTLVWYQGNNGDYLRSLLSGGGGSGSKPGPNVLQNGGFESWSEGAPAGWSVLNNTNGSFSKGTKSNNVHGGKSSLKVKVNSSSDAWKTQIQSPKFQTVKGATYRVTFWIKTSGSGSKYQVEGRSGSTKYSGTQNTPTSYTKETFSFKAKASTSSIAFDMGASAAGITWIDDVTVKKISSGGGSSKPAPNLLKKGGFESWSKGAPAGWSVLNNNNGSFSKGTKSNNVHKGDNSLKVTTESSDKAYKLQILSPDFSTKKGEIYKVTFWIKASGTGSKYQIEGRSGTNVKYSGTKDTPTSYTMETFSFKAKASSSSIAFDMGASPAGITWIDNVEVKHVPKNTGGGGAAHKKDSTAVANFMKKYITQTVSHYKGKVKGWDVVNEPFTESGGLRSGGVGVSKGKNIFHWGKYVGPGYIPMAFRYARQADSNAKLYINDYNLESNADKLDALVNLVNKMKSNGVPIDGIGTQMHISINTSLDGIDNAFKKLASTGLLIRVSELDIRINPTDIPGFKPVHRLLVNQGLMYNYVVWSYLKYVPKDQRAGIAVWNLVDNHSWIVVNQEHDDYPTLFNKDYHKKPAFSGMMRGLEGLEPNEKGK